MVKVKQYKVKKPIELPKDCKTGNVIVDSDSRLVVIGGRVLVINSQGRRESDHRTNLDHFIRDGHIDEIAIM